MREEEARFILVRRADFYHPCTPYFSLPFSPSIFILFFFFFTIFLLYFSCFPISPIFSSFRLFLFLLFFRFHFFLFLPSYNTALFNFLSSSQCFLSFPLFPLPILTIFAILSPSLSLFAYLPPLS